MSYGSGTFGYEHSACIKQRRCKQIAYIAGENEENIKPRYPLSEKLANVENLVKSFGLALTQRSNVPEPCNICGKFVNNKKKHMKSHNPEQHKCPLCPISLTRADNLKRHLRMKHCSAFDIR